MERRQQVQCELQCPYLKSVCQQAELAGSGDLMTAYVAAGPGLGYLWRSFRSRQCEGPAALPQQPNQEPAIYCSFQERALLPDGRPASKAVDLSPEALEHPYMRNPERWWELYGRCKGLERQAVVNRIGLLNHSAYPEEEYREAESKSLEEIYQAYGRDSLGKLVIPQTRERMQQYDVVLEIYRALSNYSIMEECMDEHGMSYDEAIDEIVQRNDAVVQSYATGLLLKEHETTD